METKRIMLIGASSHAKAIIDVIEKINNTKRESLKVIGMVDDNSTIKGILDIPILGKIDYIEELVKKDSSLYYIIAIADNKIRRYIAEKYSHLNLKYYTAIHPTAILGIHSRIGNGTVIMAETVIGPFASIGNHVIMNTLSAADHDNIVEDFVHITLGGKCAGSVTIKKGSFICTGASVIPGVVIGENTIVGAGAVVTKDLPSNCTAVGIPAKIIKYHRD